MKTLAYELWEQLGFQAPDNVVVPLGYGSNVLGCERGSTSSFAAARSAGVPASSASRPRAAPLLRGVPGRRGAPRPHVDRADRGGGDRVREAHAGPRVLRAVRESGEPWWPWTRAEIVERARVARAPGPLRRADGGRGRRGADALQATGAVRPEETTVLVLTGSGLKASAAIGELLEARGARRLTTRAHASRVACDAAAPGAGPPCPRDGVPHAPDPDRAGSPDDLHRRRARPPPAGKGWPLTYPEALALICDEMHEAARGGASYDEVVVTARGVLTEDDVLEGVADLVGTVKLECLFGDGTRVLHVERPDRARHQEDGMRPGEILFGEGAIPLNAGRPTAEVTVTNTSDHTIFVSSHFPFFEVNRRLVFDRALAWGMHLDSPAGDSVRWRPGETRTVRLVGYGGRRAVRGFNRLTEGLATPERLPEGLARMRERATGTGPGGAPEDSRGR